MHRTSERAGPRPAIEATVVEPRRPDPRRRLRRSTRRGGLFRFAAGLGMALVAVLGLASLMLPPEPAAAIARPPRPDDTWVDIRQLLRLFDLAGSPFARLPLAYAARRRPDGSAREDTLTFGTFAPAGRYLRLALAWGAGLPAEPPDLVVDLARFAAADGLGLTHVGLPASVPTRFGLAVTAPLELRRSAVALPCLGFRLETLGPARTVTMTGLLCGTADRAAEAADLACAVDRFDLTSAGDDAALRDFFVAAERRRGPACTGPRPLTAGL